MLNLSMLAGLNSLVDLLHKAYQVIAKSAVKETKISILELCCLINDTVTAAERLLQKVGNVKNIKQINDSEVDWRYIMLELKGQLSRLYRINSIIQDNSIMKLNRSLTEQFDILIKWKEGVLFGYGAAIQFFYSFGINDISKTSDPEQGQFDILRFCFFHSEPNYNINREEIEKNLKSLKDSLKVLEDDVKQLLTLDEVTKFSEKARAQADKHSFTDPTMILNDIKSHDNTSANQG